MKWVFAVSTYRSRYSAPQRLKKFSRVKARRQKRARRVPASITRPNAPENWSNLRRPSAATRFSFTDAKNGRIAMRIQRINPKKKLKKNFQGMKKAKRISGKNPNRVEISTYSLEMKDIKAIHSGKSPDFFML
mgnify:CR=1 FL=1